MLKKIIASIICGVAFTICCYIEVEAAMIEIPPPPRPVALEIVEETAESTEKRVIDPSRPMIALTFDDGPSLFTAQIVETLEKYGGRATFFVVGERISDWSDTVERMHQSGFEVVGHSWDHPDLTTLSAVNIAWQLLETHNAIENVIGTVPKIFRPPFGVQNAVVRSVARDLGFAIIDWSADPKDWYVLCAETIAYRVLRDAGDGDVVLMHDLLEVAAIAMEYIVPELVARGYQLVTVSELFYYRGVALEAGIVYHNAPPYE